MSDEYINYQECKHELKLLYSIEVFRQKFEIYECIIFLCEGAYHLRLLKVWYMYVRY